MLDTATHERVLTNARIVVDDEIISGSLRFEGGRIAAIDTGNASTAGSDFEGDYLIPGLIDLHTDNLERHFQPRAGVTWDGVAAAIAHDAQVTSAGITTVFDSLTIGASQGWDARAEMVGPMINGLFDALQAGMLRIEHMLHLRCEITHPDLIGIFERHRDQGPVHMVSLMDHAPGDRQSPDIAAYRRRYQKGGMSDEVVDAHIQGLIEASREYGPANCEGIAERARLAGIPLATHDDRTAEHVDKAIELGACFTEFPTTIAAAERAKEHGLPVLMGSPNLVRGSSHTGNVSAGELVQADLLDLLASDYIPASLIKGAFRLTQEPHDLSLPMAIASVTRAPAQAAGLLDRGRIAEGLQADLVRVRLIQDRPIVREVWRAGHRVA